MIFKSEERKSKRKRRLLGDQQTDMMSATSPKSSLVKLGLYPKQKTLKVMVIGPEGVGKSAMVVRFITKRFIGDYDPTLEKVYAFHTLMDNEMIYFDILDSAAQPEENQSLALEANIRWAEAFILVYSVTDKCSFDECYRLRFLINYNKQRRRSGVSRLDSCPDVPIVLVGNKIDQPHERMVTPEEGQRRSKEIGCVCFHEISARESIDQVWSVFRDVSRFWRVLSKCPSKLKRSCSDNKDLLPLISPETVRHLCSMSTLSPGSALTTKAASTSRRWTECELEEEDEEAVRREEGNAGFRGRASTDGRLVQKPRKWRCPPPTIGTVATNLPLGFAFRSERRMSISMRGNNASY